MEKVYNNLEKFEFVGSNYKPKDEFVVYRDIDDMARVFVTKKTLKRFNIIQPVFSLTLDSGLEIFEISPRDVVFMIEHTNNASSPYTMRYQNIDFKNELIDREQDNNGEVTNEMDVINIYRDIDDPDKAFVTLEVLNRFQLETPQHKVLIDDMMVYEIDSVQAINIISKSNNRYSPYQIHYINLQMNVPKQSKEEDIIEKMMSEEFGLNITLKPLRLISTIVPRSKKPNETEEDYVVYLEGFYDTLYGKEKSIEREYRIPSSIDAITISNEKTIGENDKDYAEYLKKYADGLLNDELLESIQFRNVFIPHGQSTDESDGDYHQGINQDTTRIVK